MIEDCRCSLVVGDSFDLQLVRPPLLESPQRVDDPLAVRFCSESERRVQRRVLIPEQRERRLADRDVVLVEHQQPDQVLVGGDPARQRHHVELEDLTVVGAAFARSAFRGQLVAVQNTVAVFRQQL